MKNYFYLILLVVLPLTIFSQNYLSEDSDYLDIYYEEIESGGFAFYGDNSHFIPQFISLGFTKLTNMKMESQNPHLAVLQPGDKRVLLTKIIPIQTDRSYSFRSRLSYTNGDPINISPEEYLYTFPFEHGAKFKLDQGFGGIFSHQGENFFALDFTMDVGTPICAARSGVVIEVKEDSSRGGVGSSYKNDANFVSIYHSDGTFANYAHLRKNGVIVEVGDTVEEGDIIGYSGNTGYSSGPHLHFTINVPTAGGVRESIPMVFRGLNDEAIDPIAGNYYYSKHSDGDDFEVIFGKDLVNNDFKNYIKKVDKSNKFEFRDESVDSTTIIYCRNGYDKKLIGKITFKLQNSVLSKKAPIEVIVPPLSEIFVTLVYPKNPAKAFGFSYSISYSVEE